MKGNNDGGHAFNPSELLCPSEPSTVVLLTTKLIPELNQMGLENGISVHSELVPLSA